MNPEAVKQFLFIAAIACFLSVVTTIGIHGFFNYGPLDFDQRILLFQNPTYLLNRWWVIIHCLLVAIAMWGFLLVQFKKSPGFAGLGFLFFAVFSITEIFRQLLVLFYLNGIRAKYLQETSAEIKTALQVSIENFDLTSNSLFGLFILAFALGNLCYGMSLLKDHGFTKVLAYLFLLWSVMNFLALFNDFWQFHDLSTFIEYFSLIFQPAMRLVIGIWLWQCYQSFTTQGNHHART